MKYLKNNGEHLVNIGVDWAKLKPDLYLCLKAMLYQHCRVCATTDPYAVAWRTPPQKYSNAEYYSGDWVACLKAFVEFRGKANQWQFLYTTPK